MVPSTVLFLGAGGGEPAETAVLGLALLMGFVLAWLLSPVRRLDPPGYGR